MFAALNRPSDMKDKKLERKREKERDEWYRVDWNGFQFGQKR